jgi:hypothetical protein
MVNLNKINFYAIFLFFLNMGHFLRKTEKFWLELQAK